jgi:hypothetical protein
MNIDLKSIQSRRQEIIQLVDRLKNQEAELANAEAVLQRLAKTNIWQATKASSTKAFARGAAPKKSARAETPKPRTTKRAAAGRRDGSSQKDLVLAALKGAQSAWLTTGELVTAIKRAHKVELPKKSLSPLLTVLKRSGAIVRDGRRVAAASRAKKR